MGEGFLEPALRAAFVSAIVGTAAGVWLTGIPVQMNGPRISLALVLAGLFSVSAGLTPVAFVALVGMTTFIAGLLQFGFGLLRLGSLIRYVPYPVLAGFMSAVALAVILNQLPVAFAGLLPVFPMRIDTPQPESIGIAVLTFAICVLAARVRRIPAPIWGLVIGSACFHLLRYAHGDAPAYQSPAAGLGDPLDLFVFAAKAPDLAALADLLPVGLTLAIVASLESLMSAAGLQRQSGRELRANVELCGQGASNILIGLAGGLASAGSPVRSDAAYRAGARTRAASFFHCLVLVIFVWQAESLIAMIPTAVIVGVLMHNMFESLRTWLVRPVQRFLLAARSDRQTRREVLLIPLVIAAGLAYGPTGAVLVGVGTAMVLFIMLSSRSVVRGVQDGRKLRSSIQRDAQSNRVLDENGARIASVELAGALFFGTADQLQRDAGYVLDRSRIVVLDIDRVTLIDGSGAMALADFAERAGAGGAILLVAGGRVVEAYRPALTAAGFIGPDAGVAVLADGDHALENAETRLLEEFGVAPGAAPPSMAAWSTLRGLPADGVAHLEGIMESQLLPAGGKLFHQGDYVSALYFIKSGLVSVHLEDGTGVLHRLAAFTPGTVIGEIAFLEGGARSATALAEVESEVLSLSRKQFEHLEAERPDLARILIANVAQEIARRLRITTLSARRRLA